MSKDNNLHDYLSDLADAIREKKGGNELINAQNFADEIRAFEIAEEIKSQDKEVEVASNGTLEVTPDAGFDYLNKVIVNISVTQGSDSDGGGMKYYDISGNTSEQRQMIIGMAGILGKIPGQDINPIPRLLLENGGAIIPEITCVAILPDAEVVLQGNVLTIETILGGLGAPLSSLLEITKEEFYTS